MYICVVVLRVGKGKEPERERESIKLVWVSLGEALCFNKLKSHWKLFWVASVGRQKELLSKALFSFSVHLLASF